MDERYAIEFAPSAAKELRDLPLSVKLRIESVVDRLVIQPRPSSVRKLKGFEATYRIRVGDYRIVYEIDDKRHEILITKVRHRKEAYA
jgi:mRNA interferase RelE/StbE